MSNFDETVIRRLTALEREVERLRVKERPVGAWQDWTPTLIGWSGTPTILCARYCLIGKVCFFAVDVSGTSNNTDAKISAPFPTPDVTGLTSGGAIAYGINGGSALTVAGRWWIAQNSQQFQAYTNMASAGWATSGTKRVRIVGFYEVK